MERFVVRSVNPEGGEKYIALLGKSENGFPEGEKRALLVPENKGITIKECFLSESPQRILIKGAARRLIPPGSSLLPYNSLITLQNRLWIIPEVPLKSGKYLLQLPELMDMDFEGSLKRKGSLYSFSSGKALPSYPGAALLLRPQKLEEGKATHGRIFLGDPVFPEQNTKLEKFLVNMPSSVPFDSLSGKVAEILGYGHRNILPPKEGDLLLEEEFIISPWFLKIVERELLSRSGKPEGESKAELIRKIPLPLFFWENLIEHFSRKGIIIRSGNRVFRSPNNSKPAASPVSKAVFDTLQRAGMEGSHINAFREEFLRRGVEGLLARGEIISLGRGFIFTKDSYQRLLKTLFLDKLPGDRLSPGDPALNFGISKTRILTLFHHLREKGFLENRQGNWYIKRIPDD